MIEVQNTGYGFKSQKLLLAFAPDDNLDLEKTKGYIHIGHGAEWTEDKAAGGIGESSGRELFHGLLPGDIGFETANAWHFESSYESFNTCLGTLSKQTT